MAVTIGRLQPDNVLDYRFVALSHNTIRGAAGAAASRLSSVTELSPSDVVDREVSGIFETGFATGWATVGWGDTVAGCAGA